MPRTLPAGTPFGAEPPRQATVPGLLASGRPSFPPGLPTQPAQPLASSFFRAPTAPAQHPQREGLMALGQRGWRAGASTAPPTGLPGAAPIATSATDAALLSIARKLGSKDEDASLAASKGSVALAFRAVKLAT